MDCGIFRKRLTDLLEDNISNDLKKAMLSHIEECNSCSEIYYKEIEEDNLFKKALSDNHVEFKKIRGDIMKNIDKNKYGKNPLKKSKHHFKNYLLGYGSLAVVVALAFIFAPKFLGNKDVAMDKAQKSLNSAPNVESKKEAAIVSSVAPTVMDTNDKNLNANLSLIKFDKKALDSNTQPSFNTPWETAPSNKYRATVEGKGEEAIEEGIGKVIIEDLSNKGKVSFELADNNNQKSPKQVKWVDDDNILVIVGDGYGTTSKGGLLYLLNTKTLKAVNADVDGNIKYGTTGREEAMKVSEVKGNQLEVLVNVYEDDNLNKSHTEKRIINFPVEDLKKAVQ